MSARDELARRIEIIERGYEYLLAFAAQGRPGEAGSEVRITLEGMLAALQDLDQALQAALREQAAPQPHDASAFVTALQEDARKARGALAFVLNRNSISSLLVDNLNASIHVRALLTDLFLADQGLRQAGP